MNFNIKASRSIAALAATVTVGFAALPGFANPASAASQADCSGGAFRITLPDGKTVSGDGVTAKFENGRLTDASLVKFRGKYIEFDFAPRTGNVYNYVYTGAANADTMNPGQSVTAMASKTLALSSKLGKDSEIRIEGEHARILSRAGGDNKVKVQAKDCATGGLFQHEVETTAPVKVTHTLGTGVFYYVNPYTGKINFGNGAGFVGKDSPQMATKLSQEEFVTTWSLQSGGRMGQVLGEDAVEIGSGPTACVQDCQAQNRVRGSLPVTDPAFSG